MSVSRSYFGTMPDGKEVELFSITNEDKITLQVITYGATLQALYTPDKYGKINDITIGFDSLYGHLNFSDNQGKTVGRYANRIANGAFTLNQKKYQLNCNEKDITCLHSDGEFSCVVWDAEITGENSVEFSYTSPDGTSGFEGNLTAKVKYTLDGKKVIIDYDAVCDKDTVMNFTNHAYFNLSGSASSDVLNHILQMNCPYFTPTDINSIPTGEIRDVKNTAFDFTVPETIGKRIYDNDEQLINCGGYDHNFCIECKDDNAAVSVSEPVSGRTLKVYTDLPGVQLYTGNFLDGTVLGKGGMPLVKHAGFCLETQYYPDTPNQPDFPQCTFKAGEKFNSRTVFETGIE
ncbi:MAG: galactose mutarotase [Ruminococcus sp.]|nr:galactose mutarotase [Candidatus Copronaster equi]